MVQQARSGRPEARVLKARAVPVARLAATAAAEPAARMAPRVAMVLRVNLVATVPQARRVLAATLGLRAQMGHLNAVRHHKTRQT